MPRLRSTVAVVALAGLTMTVALVLASQAAAGGASNARWAAAANKACAASYAKVEALPRVTTRDLAVADLRAVVRLSKQLTQQLSQIPAPPSERSTVGQLLQLAISGNSIVERQLVPALLMDDEVAVARYSTQSSQIGARFNAVARALGARICAENPAPSA